LEGDKSGKVERAQERGVGGPGGSGQRKDCKQQEVGGPGPLAAEDQKKKKGRRRGAQGKPRTITEAVRAKHEGGAEEKLREALNNCRCTTGKSGRK